MIRAFLTGLLLGLVLAWGYARWQDTQVGPDLAALERWERDRGAQTKRLRDSLDREVPVAVRWRTRWDTLTTVDSLRLTDTVWVRQVLATGDSAVRSCAIALTTCQQLAQTERERADSALRLAELYRHQARGPFLRPSAELLFEGRTPRLAGVLEAGPQRLSAVARLEVDSLPRFAFGVRYRF